MAEKYSVIVMGHSGRLIRRIGCSTRRIYALCGGLMLLLAALAAGTADYAAIKHKDYHCQALCAELALKRQEVLHHRRQIQTFAR